MTIKELTTLLSAYPEDTEVVMGEGYGKSQYYWVCREGEGESEEMFNEITEVGRTVSRKKGGKWKATLQ